MIGVVLETYNFNEKNSKGTNYVYKKNYYTIIYFNFIFSIFWRKYFYWRSIPQGEFDAQEVPSSFAIDLNALYYLNDYAAFGFNFGGSQYGYTEREIPFNQWVALGLIEETRNSMLYGNLLLKILPFKGPVKILGKVF